MFFNSLLFFNAPLACSAAFSTLPDFTVEGFSVLTVANVPDFSQSPTCSSAASGLWSSPATWAGQIVPSAGDAVAITSGHRVVYDIAPTDAVSLDRVAVQNTAKLVFSPNMDTELQTNTLYVGPGGLLTVGTPSEPIAAEATARLVLGDGMEVNHDGQDPLEFGLGLLVLGSAVLHSAEQKLGWVRLQEEIDAGVNSLLVWTDPKSPHNWLPGDRLLLPDSRQLNLDAKVRGEYKPLDFGHGEFVQISDIAPAQGGRYLGLASPTSHAHPGARNATGEWDLDAEGRRRFVPVVANMQRNIIVESKAPGDPFLGQVRTRAHVMVTGDGRLQADGVHFRNLGRTRLDRAPTKEADGGNMIGRYGVHFHHAIGPAEAASDQFIHTMRGCVVENSAKW